MNKESIKQNRRRWNQSEKQKNSLGKRKTNSRKNNKRKKKKHREHLNWKDKKSKKKIEKWKMRFQRVKDVSVYRHAYRSAGKKGLGTRAIYDRNSELRRAEMYTVITIRGSGDASASCLRMTKLASQNYAPVYGAGMQYTEKLLAYLCSIEHTVKSMINSGPFLYTDQICSMRLPFCWKTTV